MSDSVREALQTLRDNIRDEKGSVQRMGVHDNNDTRDAIAVLLENEAALSANGGEAVGEIVSLDGDNYISTKDDTLRELLPGTKLYTHPAPPSVAVPEGWRLVPVEPTTEMLGEGAIALFAQSREPLSSAYRSMLAAAPRCPMLTAAPSGDAKREAEIKALEDFADVQATKAEQWRCKGSLTNEQFHIDCAEQAHEEAARLRQSDSGDDSEGVE